MNETELKSQLIAANKNDAIILAIGLAEKLIADGVNEVWILEIYAANLIAIGRYDDADQILKQAEHKASEKRLPWVLHRKAILQEQRGRLEAALNLWKQANVLNPHEATFLIYAASVAHRLGWMSEAEELARNGTTCQEGYPDEAWYNLGGYLAGQKRYKEALECYEKAVEIDPEYDLAIKRREELRDPLLKNIREQTAGENASRPTP